MKFVFTTCLVILFATFGKAQELEMPKDDETMVRTIAAFIMQQTAYQFEDVATGKLYSSTKDIPEGVKVKIKSPFNKWHYTNGVLNLAMLDLGELLKDERYTTYPEKHVAFAWENYKYFEKRYTGTPEHWFYPFGELFNMKQLDDCGALGASLIEINYKLKNKEYSDYINRTAKHISEKQDRLADGTLCRTYPYKMTVWADDMYMSIPFLTRMGKLTNDKKYWDDATKQILNFNKYLWVPAKELYHHCYYDDLKTTNGNHWGRSNGWVMMATVNHLSNIPANYPQRDTIIKLLRRQIIGVAKYQDAQGLWHQVLDKNDSYSESSCTAMFVYCTAKAINQGWLDKRYASIALLGWEGLKKYKITADGQLKDVCMGTDTSTDVAYYYNRPAHLNEIHGLGALIEAGVEIIKLKKLLNLK